MSNNTRAFFTSRSRRFSRLIASVVFALVTLSAASPVMAGASDIKPLPLEPGQMPADRRPIKLYEENKVDLFSGSYHYVVPISLPPAKGGLEPEVFLAYDSSTGHGDIGYGWELGKSCITRDLVNGVPRYVGPAGGALTNEDPLAFQLGRKRGKLVYDTTYVLNNALVYRPKIEDSSFLQFHYHGYNNLDPGERWTLYDLSGKTWTFGGSGAIDSDGTPVYAWCLSSVSDLDGNRIEYTYTSEDGYLYLTKIEYDIQFASNSHPSVVFTWDTTKGTCPSGKTCLSDHSVSYVKGYRSEKKKRLVKITVYGYEDADTSTQPASAVAPSREYELQYEPTKSYGSSTLGLPNLSLVAPEDSAPGSPFPATEFEYQGFPSDSSNGRFTIADPDTAGGLEDQYSLQASHGELITQKDCHEVSTSLITNTLVDVDGDGDKDILGVLSGKVWASIGNSWQWFWRENTNGISFATNAQPINLPSTCSYANSTVDGCHPMSLTYARFVSSASCNEDTTSLYQGIYDMTRDGAADLVYTDSGTIYVCPGSYNATQSAREFGACFAWASASYLTRTKNVYSGVVGKWYVYDDADIFDINGDGYLDHVVAKTNPASRWNILLKASLNLGDTFPFTQSYEVSAPRCDEIANAPDTPCIRSNVRFPGWTTPADVGLSAAPKGCLLRDVTDMSGDGVVDLVRAEPKSHLDCRQKTAGSFRYYHGTTSGFDLSHGVASNLTKHPVGRFSGDFYLATIPQDSVYAFVDEGTFHDVNGDGYKDLILGYKWTHYSVKLGSESGFLAERNWLIDATEWEHPYPTTFLSFTVSTGANSCIGDLENESGTWRHSYVGQVFMDIDGDGAIEIVSIPKLADLFGTSSNESCSFSNVKDTPWKVFELTPAQNSGRLETVESENGQTTRVSYTLPRRDKNDIPVPRWMADEITYHDEVTNKQLWLRFAYYQGLYLPETREFRGFGRVEVIDDEKKVQHLFHQGEFNQGSEYLTETWKRNGGSFTLKLKEVSAVYDVVSLAASRKIVRPSVVRTTLYANAEGQNVSDLVTVVDYDYDDSGEICPGLHLHKATIYNGGTADARTDTYDYECSAMDPYLMVKTREIRSTQSGGTSTIHARTKWVYDNVCQDASNTKLTRGKVCKKLVARGTGLADAQTSYTYDYAGRPSMETSPDGERVVNTYHGTTPFLHQVTNDLGHKTTHKDYDGLSGRARVVCGPQHAGTPESDNCTTTKLDRYGRVLEVYVTKDDPSGGYLTAQKLIERVAYSDLGSAGKPSYVRVTKWPGTVGDPAIVETTYLDADGNTILEERSHAGGKQSKIYFEYDTFDRLQTAYPAFLSTAQGYSAVEAATGSHYSYEYDPLDRITKILTPDGVGNRATTYEGPTTHLFVGAGLQNRLKSITVNRNLEVTAITRYPDQTSTSAPSLTAKYSYDGAGRWLTAIDEEGAVYAFIHKLDGTPSLTWTPTALISYQHTAGGKLEKVTKLAGSTITYTHDAVGRVKTRTVVSAGQCAAAGTREDTFFYDEETENLGRLTAIEGDDYRIDYDYEAQGRTTRKELRDLDEDRTLWIARTYTDQGAIKIAEYSDGTQVSYDYDAAGLLYQIADDSGALEVSSVVYAADGRPEKLTGRLTNKLPFSRTVTYDDHRRIKAIDTTTPAHANWHIGYTFNERENVNLHTDNVRGIKRTYTYDDADRLRYANGYPAGSAGLIEYAYHKNGALDSVKTGSTTETYVYAGTTGQLLSSITKGSSTRSFTSDADGQRCDAKVGGTTEVSLQWNGDGTLDEAAAGGGTSRFFYDASGNRWKAIREAEGQSLYLDEAELKSGGDAEGLRKHIALPGGVTCSLVEDAGKCWFSDAQHTAAVLNEDGTLAQLAEYAPYGQKRIINGASAPDFDFSGKRRETGGLLYFGARYYDDTTRQWLSIDPLRTGGASDTIGGLNLLQPYAYASSNPTTYTDPNGLDVPDLPFGLKVFMVLKGATPGLAAWQVAQTLDRLDLSKATHRLHAAHLILTLPAVVVFDRWSSTLSFAPGARPRSPTPRPPTRRPTQPPEPSPAVGPEAGSGGSAATKRLPAPKARGCSPGQTVDPTTGTPVGRFIVDSKGNTMIEPVGGSTVGAGRTLPGGIRQDTHTTYPNGSTFQRLNASGHGNNPTPHGHGHGVGTGPGMRGQGPALDIHGNVVPRNSPAAHWPAK